MNRWSCEARTRRGPSFPIESRRSFFADFTMSWMNDEGRLLNRFDRVVLSSRKPGPKTSFLGSGQVVQ